MRLTPTEQDRLLIFTAAQLARSRRARGLLLNVPEATALISDEVCEAARDGARLKDAARRGRSVLGFGDVLPGVSDIVTEIKVEAVFDDGTRMVVVREPFGEIAEQSTYAPGVGAMTHPVERDATGVSASSDAALTHLEVINTSEVPVSITSHFHFFEVNRLLRFDRTAAYGMRLAIPAGQAQRFDPGVLVDVRLTPIGGDRIAIGFAGLVDGELDDPATRAAALQRATEQGFLST
ncbi:urease subunit gamma [Ornithinimicrobium sp. INDO-MA30-4]|uniref:urease subunit gamma n=1 Tax=Ornithinimicrobium sp. INDO-MA30-4 TaxID=2908651 RepID=UPI001F3854CC|nr:urease subunit gamma [Ornithinimicrobium sp. INDO-MA30-4]UJH70335.1 urease subunit gamma [Ornithinimicrobium sp. INDO-MA30-4]